MFEDFIRRRKAKKTIRSWRKSPLRRSLEVHAEEYSSGYAMLANGSAGGKQKMLEDVCAEVLSILGAKSPLLAFRKEFASHVWRLANVMVLCLTEEEKSESWCSDCPYISGSLWRDIEKLTQASPILEAWAQRRPGAPQKELVFLCDSFAARGLFYLGGYNFLRAFLGDVSSTRDWVRPFFLAQLIVAEDMCRWRAGIPSLLPDSLDGLKYYLFEECVIDVAKDPLYEWETRVAKLGVP